MEEAASDPRSQTHDPTQLCAFHGKPHPLPQCRAFRAKPLDEKSILKKNRICYRCVASATHLAKDCPSTAKYCECQSEKHVSAMHAGTFVKANVGNAVEVATAGSESSLTPDGNDRTTGHDGEPITRANCTELCGKSYGGRSCSKICLAQIYDESQPEKKVLACRY